MLETTARTSLLPEMKLPAVSESTVARVQTSAADDRQRISAF